MYDVSMLSGGAEKRKRLFDIYATNLSFFKPELGADWFMCPICGWGVRTPAIEDQKHGLSLGHVWPESAGGTLATLECKRCNTGLGGRFDHQIAEDFRVWNAFGGSGQGSANDCRMVFEYDGKQHSVGVEITFSTERGLHLREIKQTTDPRSSKAMLKCMTSKGGAFKGYLKIPVVHQQKHAIAVLHSAYLSMFRHFGYEYVFAADHAWIRDLLRSTDVPDAVPIVSVNVPAGAFTLNPDEVMHAVAILQFTDGLKCFGVPQPTPDPKLPVRVVLMPGFFDEGQDHFQKIQQREAYEVKFEVLFEFDKPEERLIIPEAKTYGRELWIRAFR